MVGFGGGGIERTNRRNMVLDGMDNGGGVITIMPVMDGGGGRRGIS